jgi:ribosomal protein S11
MLKPKKNLKFKKLLTTEYKEKASKNKLSAKALGLGFMQSKNFFRFRKMFNNKSYVLNPTHQEVIGLKNSTKPFKKLSVRVTPNNIFCTLTNLANNKTLSLGSSGKYAIKTSKKKLRFSSKLIIQSFLEDIKKKIKTDPLLINLISPIKIRKAILKQLSGSLKGKDLILNIEEKKCFNGCRSKKNKRKKHKGLRIFK